MPCCGYRVIVHHVLWKKVLQRIPITILSPEYRDKNFCRCCKLSVHLRNGLFILVRTLFMCVWDSCDCSQVNTHDLQSQLVSLLCVMFSNSRTAQGLGCSVSRNITVSWCSRSTLQTLQHYKAIYIGEYYVYCAEWIFFVSVKTLVFHFLYNLSYL